MADRVGTGQEETARLEAALERISRAGARHPAASPAPPDPQLAGRLEALIAEIRAALGRDSGDEAVVYPTIRPR
jgi:hypothetical protein